jgi:hypothetical protein
VSETTGGNTVGTIHLGLEIKDNLEHKVKQISQRSANSAQKILDGINVNKFNGQVERAKGKLQDLNTQYDKLIQKLDSMRFAGSGAGADKAFQKMSAQADALTQKISAQERELEIRRKEAAQRALQASQREQAKIAEAARKSAAAQQAAAEKASQAQEQASMRAAKAAEQAAAASRARMRKSLKESTQGIRRLGRTIRESFKAVFITAALYAAFRGLKDLFVNTAKQSDQFGAALNRLKGNLASAFQPIISSILPWLTALIDKLAQAAAAVSGFISRLFGTTFAKSKQATASIKSTAAAAQKAAGQMASFDEHVVLSKETGAGESAGAGAAMSQEDLNAAAAGETFADRLLEKFAALKARFDELVDWSNLTAALERLKEAFAPFAENVGAGLYWFLENVLIPLSAWAINELIPAFLDLLAAAITTLNDIIEVAKPSLEWLWNNVLLPLGQWTGGMIIDVLQWLREKLEAIGQWVKEHQDAFNEFVKILGVVVTAILAVKTALALIAAVTALLTSPITLVVAGIAALAAGFVYLYENVGWFKDWIDGVIKYIEDLPKKVKQFVDDMKEFFGLITQGWDGTWDEMEKKTSNSLGNMETEVSKSTSKMREWLSSIGSGISNAVSSAKNWVSGKLESAGLIRHPEVPGFASGSVVRKPTLAMVGEYAGASSNPEIVAPQSMMAETFLGSIMPLVSMLEDKLDVIAQLLEVLGHSDGTAAGSAGGDALAQLARILAPYMKSEGDRTGNNLFDRR